MTAHHAAEKEKHLPLWSGTLPHDATIAIYMPGNDYGALQTELLDAGLEGATPCVAISCAGTPEESWQRSELGKLGELQAAPAPVVLLVGEGLKTAKNF